jgi:hypothetical protein
LKGLTIFVGKKSDQRKLFFALQKKGSTRKKLVTAGLAFKLI